MSVFAWKPADMPGVPRNLIEHSLNVSKTARPIKQKLRRFARDKKEAIRTEITRLLAAGFIKEVYHPQPPQDDPSSSKRKTILAA